MGIRIRITIRRKMGKGDRIKIEIVKRSILVLGVGPLRLYFFFAKE